MRKPDSPRRRKLLAGIGAGFVAVSTGTAATTAQQETVTVTVDNVGTTAWEVTGVDGGDGVAETGVENPTLTLQESVRYTFENQGWSSHPLAFRAADGSGLLSQSDDGSFEGDSEVNWVDEGGTVSFTVTSGLAEQLASYRCTVHPSMEGTVEVTTGQAGVATVEFSDQSTDGTSVVVDSANLPDGGFVTIHDSSLNQGETIPSVVGTSDYLGPGGHDEIAVEFEEPITEDDTLIAMPHRDTNANETYDFVETEGSEDGPYTADGGAVTDDAAVTVQAAAAVTMSDQETDGTSVVVDSVRLDDGGFVTIHDSSLNQGETIPSVVGVSGYLEPGTYEDVEVEFDDPLTEDDTLIAMPHRDTNANETYDFVETEGSEDGPYLALEGGAVVDPAEVTVVDDSTDDGMGDGMDDTDDGMDDTDDGMDDTDDGMGDGMDDTDDGEDNGTADDGGPGFGPVAGAAGAGGLATYAYRRLRDPSTSADGGEEGRNR